MGKTQIQVLLVEDNPADVIFLREALKKDPLTTFELTAVERLSTALDSLHRAHFEVILLDLGLPDSLGLETFAQIHRQAPEVPVVVFSGNSDEQAAIEAVRAGAQDYLVKGQAAYNIAARTIRYAVERQQTQLSLRASEKHWRTLIEQNHDAIALVTADGTILYESPAARRILGYAPEELLGKTGLELVHPEDQAAAAQDLAQILNSPGETVQTQTRFIHQNGQTIWIEAANTNWLADPDLQAIVINYRDITERKQAELKLQESEKRFSTAFFTSPVSQSILSQATGLIMEVNDNCCELYGYSRAELIGVEPKRLDLWANPADQLVVLDELQRSGHLRPTEILIRRKSGEIRAVLFAVEPLTWKGAPSLITSSIDITERKQAEQTLHETEERLELVMEGSQLGYWDWNIETGEVHRNARWAEMLGYTLDEIRFNVRQWTDLHHPDDKALAWKSIQEHLDGKTEAHRAEYRLRTKAGGYKWVLDQAKVVARDAQGQPLRMCGTHTDITERKQAEENLRESEARFAALFRSNPVPVGITRATDFHIVDVNQAWSKLTGYAREEALGHTSSELGLTEPETLR
jgi:PAS domain S-box-containing protein